ncbi:hypothetical protein NSK_000303 [Nannochloropsis salina CCMP1776]|uniref:Pre-mRNA-processing factor 19 n=1 Tax=Nannochloropsis salina CCMP1776 TaxID=1027361 RepID=A0A4D9DCE7_9STRA|nr:hypothetical protein NSK_000303 [Nannochloropsis salina CCMP1776]|eukprot:TFJ88734.1 hypothetical protein NSK_000303 [Nannochloropsis salina CCMP1776]
MDALEADARDLKARKPRIVVEIGSGSGCVTAVLARTLRDALGPDHCTLFFSTDINSRAVRATQATGSANSILHHEILQADLLAPLLPRLLHSVDLLVFNPPYVPTPTSEVGSYGIEASWAGGKDGREVLDRILDSIPNLLRPQGGCMYLVAVNENLPEDICARMREENLQAESVYRGNQHCCRCLCPGAASIPVMHCGISGEICEEPVLSRPSGVLYEKRVILKYIEAEHKDPANGEELSPDDLIPVKASTIVRPRPVTASSELANALYQHDAACRVIARLSRERDSALAQLSALQSSFAQRAVAQATEEAMEVEPAAQKAGDLNTPLGMSETVLGNISNTWERLSKGRKKRATPPGLPAPAEASSHVVCHLHFPPSPLSSSLLDGKMDGQGRARIAQHQQAQRAGPRRVSPHPNLLLTGGADKEAVVFDRKAEVVVDRLKGHSKKVTAVLFHPLADFGGLVITGSADKTVKLWKPSEKGGGPRQKKASPPATSYHEIASLTVHTNEVTGLALQATGQYFATASKDKSWAFHDASSGQCLSHVVDPAVADSFECLAFHPDGVLLGTGTNAAKVRMWDVKTQANVATFEDHKASVAAVSFSENGYYMASGSADGTVKLWDLRKLKCVQTLDAGEPVQTVSFDTSGQYLALAAGTRTQVLLSKEWSAVAEFQDHTDKVTALKFGYPASGFLATASLDRTVKVYQ